MRVYAAFRSSVAGRNRPVGFEADSAGKQMFFKWHKLLMRTRPLENLFAGLGTACRKIDVCVGMQARLACVNDPARTMSSPGKLALDGQRIGRDLRVKTQRGGAIHVDIHMVHQMESPQERHLMRQHVPEIDRVIHPQHRQSVAQQRGREMSRRARYASGHA